MKKVILMSLMGLLLLCGGKTALQQAKQGESFYSESVVEGMKIIATMEWRMVKIDTVYDIDHRKVYLMHYDER